MVKKYEDSDSYSDAYRRDRTIAWLGLMLAILAVLLAIGAFAQTRALNRTIEMQAAEMQRGADLQFRRLALRARLEVLRRQLQTEFEVADIEGDLAQIREDAQASYEEGSEELDQLEAELDGIEDAIRTGSGDAINLVQQLLERLEGAARSDDDREDETVTPENDR